MTQALSELEGSAKSLIDQGKFKDLAVFLEQQADIIEQGTDKQRLVWLADIRGLVSFINTLFEHAKSKSRQADLYKGFLGTIGPRIYRAVLTACACQDLECERYDEAIKLLTEARAIRSDDLYIQDLLATAHNKKNKGTSWGGAAPPDNWKGRFCDRPFKHFEPITNGCVFVCCPSLLPYEIGNIYEQSMDEIWNSEAAQELRGSILDGSYKYCSKMHCDLLLRDELPRSESVPNLPTSTIVAEPPKVVVLNHDRSCNLSCPSCRTELIVSGPEERTRLDTVKPMLVEAINNADCTVITNSGDPFASKHYRQILQEIRPKKDAWLYLFTNAQLFTEAEWNNLSHLHSTNIQVDISIDAVKPETYALLRRGGDFARLQNNLSFISRLRREGKLKHLRINMTVQRDNFEEIHEFVRMGHSLDCDEVFFLRMTNWGTFSPDEYLKRDVCSEGHPQNSRLKAILNDPLMKDRIVNLATLPIG